MRGGGAIITLSDDAVRSQAPGSSGFIASKAAVQAITFSVSFCEVAEFNHDGKRTRTRLYYDLASMLQQLGHMPAPDGS